MDNATRMSDHAVQRLTLNLTDPATGKIFRVTCKRFTGANLQAAQDLFERHDRERSELRERFAPYLEYIEDKPGEGAPPEALEEYEEKQWKLRQDARSPEKRKELEEAGRAMMRELAALNLLHLYEAARFMIDEAASKLSEEQAELIASDGKSDFWNEQDLNELREKVKSFRSLLAGA